MRIHSSIIEENCMLVQKMFPNFREKQKKKKPKKIHLLRLHNTFHHLHSTPKCFIMTSHSPIYSHISGSNSSVHCLAQGNVKPVGLLDICICIFIDI